MDLDTLGSLPIAGDNPAGNDVRDGPAFEALQAEIDRVNDTSAPGQTDWAKVVKLATEILATQGKDLLVASYLAVGLIKQRQVDGFAQGLKILRDMIVTHWDGLFPPVKRMRGRRNALQYWLDRSDELLGGLSTAPLEQAQVDAMRQHVDDIDAVLREKDDEPPAVFRLASFVKGLPVRVEAPPPPPPGESTATDSSGGGVVAGGEALSAVAPTTYDEALALVGQGCSVLRMAADYLLEAEPGNPLPHRISRWAAWSAIAELPHAEAGMTMLPAPDWNVGETLAGMQAAGNNAAIVPYVEGAIQQAPLWLDLNRIQVAAMEALGAPYRAAADAVRMECALLVARLPGIEQLRFADGTPLASAEAIAWLAASAGASGGGGTAAAGGEAGALQEAMTAAAGKVEQGDIAGAVAALQRSIDRTPLARDRFRARVALCRILQEQQAVANHWPYVRELLDEIDRHRLDEWEPELALSGLSVIYLGIIGSGEAAIGAPRADKILRRIARIDCAAALRLTQTQS